MFQGSVAQLPDEALAMWHLTVPVVLFKDAQHKAMGKDELFALNLAVLLQFGDEPHQRRRNSRFFTSCNPLEMYGEKR